MRKSRDSIFYAKHLPSGFYAIFANGDPKFLNASLGSIEAVRQFVDMVARSSKLTCYTLTFHEAEYNNALEFTRAIR